MKIIGCLVVITVSVYIGYWLSLAEGKKTVVCEEIYAFLRSLERGIERRIPLKEIISDFHTSDGRKYLSGDSVKEITDCLTRLINEGICTEGCRICLDVISSVGKSPDGESECKSCSEAAMRVSEILCENRSGWRKKRELYPKLGLVLGILVCITVI